MENLNEQEAIKDIGNSLEFGVPDGLKEETLLLAKSALEKQIPKKVNNRALITLTFPAYLRGDCPACGSKSLSSADTNYCNACGQKLDFGEITEEEAAKLL